MGAYLLMYPPVPEAWRKNRTVCPGWINTPDNGTSALPDAGMSTFDAAVVHWGPTGKVDPDVTTMYDATAVVGAVLMVTRASMSGPGTPPTDALPAWYSMKLII